jgi:hypothetical protein
VAYNFSALVSFILAGWAMYLWIRHLTREEGAGLVAGTIYAFFPFHMAHYIIGHLNLCAIQWLPFYFWGFLDILRSEKFSWKPILLSGGAIFLTGLSSTYYVYMAGLISLVFFGAFILFGGYKRLKALVFWKNILLFGVIAIGLVAISMAPFLLFNGQNGLASRPPEIASTYSASPTDFVLPSIYQFLWGHWIDKVFGPEAWQESTLYIGAVTFILAVIAFVRWKKVPQRQLLAMSLLVAVAAFVLALGVDLHWLGRKVVSIPVVLQPIFHRTEFPEIHLPTYYLFMHLPFFSKMRVMMRFGLFTLLFFNVMAGLGTAALLPSFAPRVRRGVLAGLLILIFIDFYPGPLPVAPHRSSPANYWLAEQPDIGSVARFPFYKNADQGGVYDTLINRKRYIGGFFNANQPEQYLRITPVMETFPSTESVAQLRRLSVSYVLVEADQYPDFASVDQAIQSLGLQPLHVSGAEHIYLLP